MHIGANRRAASNSWVVARGRMCGIQDWMEAFARFTMLRQSADLEDEVTGMGGKNSNVMEDTGAAQNFCHRARRPGDESILEAVHYHSILRPLPYSNNTSHTIQIDLRLVTSLAPRPLVIANSQEARLTVTHCMAFLQHGDAAELGSSRATIESRLHCSKSQANFLALP